MGVHSNSRSLANLGHQVGRGTVANIHKENGIEPDYHVTGQVNIVKVRKQGMVYGILGQNARLDSLIY